MKSGALRRATGLTFLYFGLFVLLVLVQFSRNPGLSEKFGRLSVSASYPKAARGQVGIAPERVRLSYAGFAVELSPKSKVESIGADGSVQALALASIDKLPSGVRVKLSGAVTLTATSEQGSPERFVLSATAPDGVVSLRLRLASSSSGFAESGGQKVLAAGGSSFALSLGSSILDRNAGTLTLHPGDPGMALARIKAPPAAQPYSSAAEKLVTQAPKDASAFSAEIALWRDKVWSGFSTTRFDADKLAWKGPDGLPVFSEKALSAYLAEALLRGSYPDALARMKGAREKWPDKLSYLSAPYLGGLVSKMRAFKAADQAEVKRLGQLVADKSPTLLEKEALLPFLVDRSPSSLAQDAMRYLAALEPAKLTVRQAVGLLSCSVDAKALLKDDDNPLQNSAAAAADRVAAAVRKASGGCFLASEDDGSTDLRLSLVAGEGLVAYGAMASKPSLVGLGQGLVEGAIGLADAQGFAPARVLAKGGELQQKLGSIAPEDVYPLVADNSYYPHEESFARAAGPGLWAWTCSPSLVLQASASRYVFTATFPVGRSHYLALYGIKPFSNIQLYDIDYSPDSDFESYDASGYLHETSSAALYMKMKHKKEAEDIKLSF